MTKASADVNLHEQGDARAQRLSFGAFEMDLRSGELRRRGIVVHLQPQPFKVLAMLVTRPDEVVTREEMQAELWPDGTSVDFEQSLNFCIRQIRLALADSAVAPRFVETLPRRGYRWIGGPVEEIATQAVAEERPAPHPNGPPDQRESPRPTASPARARTSRIGWRWGAVVVALAGPAVLATWLLRPAGPSAPQFQRMTFGRGFLTAARFGPEGQVVYAASWEGRPVALFETYADSHETRALGLSAFRLAGVSASGEVAFIRNDVLARAPLAGGPPREVATGVRGADWTADASTFAVVRSEEAGERLEYPVGHSLGRVLHVINLRISPDGRYLAFSQHPTLGDDRGFVAIVDRAGHRIATSETFASLDGLAWSPEGDEVWFTAIDVGVKNSLRALGLDGRQRSLVGSMGRLVLHDVAPDGRVLLSRCTHRATIHFQRAGEPTPADLSWLDLSAVAALSPDAGTVLFYEGGEGGGPDYMTYLRRTDGSPPVRLGRGRALDLSRDGRWALVIPVVRPDHLELLPTGAGETREIRVPGEIVTYDAAGWLPDGERLFVTGLDPAGGRSTWLVDADGRDPQRLPLPDGRFLMRSTFSPDGRMLVAECPLPDEHRCLYDASSGASRRVAGAKPGWEAVGWDELGRVFFRDRPGIGRRTRLRRVDPVTGETEVIADLALADSAGVFSVYNVFVTPDARAWVYTLIRRQSELFIATGVD